MQTGENEQGLRKILDMTRLISIVILALHFYYYCYHAFEKWKLRSTLTDRLITNIMQTGLFDHFLTTKIIALGFLIISLVGTTGRKNEKLSFKSAFAYIAPGLAIYFYSFWILILQAETEYVAGFYIGITVTGYILILTGGTLLSRVLLLRINDKDIFNSENETFLRRSGFCKINIQLICLRNIF